MSVPVLEHWLRKKRPPVRVSIKADPQESVIKGRIHFPGILWADEEPGDFGSMKGEVELRTKRAFLVNYSFLLRHSEQFWRVLVYRWYLDNVALTAILAGIPAFCLALLMPSSGWLVILSAIAIQASGVLVLLGFRSTEYVFALILLASGCVVGVPLYNLAFEFLDDELRKLVIGVSFISMGEFIILRAAWMVWKYRARISLGEELLLESNPSFVPGDYFIRKFPGRVDEERDLDFLG